MDPLPLNPNPYFVQSIQAGLQHWCLLTEALSDEQIVELDAERNNLYRLVQYASQLPALWPETAVVLLQSFYLVERRGYWQEWIPYLEVAAAEWLSEDLPLKSRLLNRLGTLYQIDRQISKAVEAHKEAEAIAIQIGADYLRYRAQFSLGADYRQLRQYDEAEGYAEAALEGFKKVGADDEKWQAATLNELGLIAYSRNDLPTAHEYLAAAARLWRKLDMLTDLVRVLNNLLSVARANKKYDEAQRYYEQAKACFEHVASEFDKISIKINIGGAYFDQGDYAKAEAVFREANSPYLQRSNHIYMRGLAAQCLGNALRELQQFEKAETCLIESKRLWMEVDDNLMLANTLGTLAGLYAAHGLSTKAIAHYQDALALLETFPKEMMARRLTPKYLARLEQLQNRSKQ